MSLALVDDDHGADVALAVARELVVFLHRPGSESQFSAQLSAQLAGHDVIRSLQRYIVDRPSKSHTIDDLADRAAMSRRHFTRVFTTQVGVTPAKYVERVRLEAARRLLETTERTVDDIALACGFRTGEILRRTM